MDTIREHLLCSDAIENDRHLAKEPTLLGAVLFGIGLTIGFGLLVFLGRA